MAKNLRRVLMLSPHFPPDSNAATHRVRLLAPHLPEYGWDPIVVTADPSRYEGRLDPDLAALVPSRVRIERYRAWSPRWTRTVGIGDLGLRSLVPALRRSSAIIAREGVDAVFITTYPIYTALAGPWLKRRHGIPYVIDLQDPWVGAWGRDVGGGRHGEPDAKSRLTRTVAASLEEPVLGGAAAITAVSARTYEDIFDRRPHLATRRTATIPIGVEPADFESAAALTPQRHFDPSDGLVHVCAVGAVLPMGLEIVRATFSALASLRSRCPQAAARLRLHFFGTSNERASTPANRVLPLADSAGVRDLITESPSRVDYLDAVRIQKAADALLLVGSTESHYTASKLYPALAARRPLIAIYHGDSSVVDILRGYTRPPTVRVVSFADGGPSSGHVVALSEAFQAVAERPGYRASDIDESVLTDYSARTLAGRLAGLLTTAVSAS